MVKRDIETTMGRWKRVAATVWPRYSAFVDLVNTNARLSQWIREHRGSMKDLPDRAALFEYLSKNVIGDQPIDYLEFGVMYGWSIRQWASLNAHPESRFFGFDSFEGLPEHWTGKFGAGSFTVGGAIPDVDDSRIQFVKGWFNETLPPFFRDFVPRNRLVINNDSDLYSSTLFTLANVDRYVSAGTVILFDEFSSPLHEYRALCDYLSAYKRSVKPLACRGNHFDTVAFEFE